VAAAPVISSRARANSRAGGGRARRSAGALGPDIARVRWDRLARVAMLFVLAALLYLYASAGFHMLGSWQQARHDRAAVSAMEHEHARLLRQRESLSGKPATEAEARQLGMMHSGEQPYVVSGLPAN
jgi:cytochrome c-type biogenesis protein CcmH/NrfG